MSEEHSLAAPRSSNTTGTLRLGKMKENKNKNNISDEKKNSKKIQSKIQKKIVQTNLKKRNFVSPSVQG